MCKKVFLYYILFLLSSTHPPPPPPGSTTVSSTLLMYSTGHLLSHLSVTNPCWSLPSFPPSTITLPLCSLLPLHPWMPVLAVAKRARLTRQLSAGWGVGVDTECPLELCINYVLLHNGICCWGGGGGEGGGGRGEDP